MVLQMKPQMLAETEDQAEEMDQLETQELVVEMAQADKDIKVDIIQMEDVQALEAEEPHKQEETHLVTTQQQLEMVVMDYKTQLLEQQHIMLVEELVLVMAEACKMAHMEQVLAQILAEA